MTQTIIVIIIVAAAVGWALHMAYRNIRHANDPCYGCAGCELHRQMMENKRKKGNHKVKCFHSK
jgi:hypothetical protein